MATEAYKVKADVSFPRPIRKVEDLADGSEVFETEGRNYPTGSYVLSQNLTPRDRKRANDGDLDHVLEPVSSSELEEAYQAQALVSRGVFVPEHEAERVVLDQAGHQIVERDQVLSLRSAGAESAKEVLAEAKKEGRDERPGLQAVETQEVPAERLQGVEQPPGIPLQDTLSSEGEVSQPRRNPRKGSSSEKKDDEK